MTERAQAAIAEASKWVEDARPIIVQYVAAHKSAEELESAVYNRRQITPYKIYSGPDISAQSIMEKARDELESIIIGVRDNALADVFIPGPVGNKTASELAEWDLVERENELVASTVVTAEEILDRAIQGILP